VAAQELRAIENRGLSKPAHLREPHVAASRDGGCGGASRSAQPVRVSPRAVGRPVSGSGACFPSWPATVGEQIAQRLGTRLEELMGSSIAALKLVSCMTLFQHVAKAIGGSDSRPRFTYMAGHARAILAAAAAQGYPRCAFTEEYLRRRDGARRGES